MTFHPRISGTDLYHHVYARGNDRHPIFKEERHYLKYLHLLQKYSSSSRIEIIAYALMRTHIHLFVHDPNHTISDFMFNLHGHYARYFNQETGRVGHVFSERYNNKIVQPNGYALSLSRYIHRQAVAAGLVNDPFDYPWTSYRIYTGRQANEFIKTDIVLGQFGIGIGCFKMYEKFVCDQAADPVDWLDKRHLIVGDDGNIKKLGKKNDLHTESMLDKPAIEDAVNKILGSDRRIWTNPCGKAERSRRHMAIRVLKNDYRFRESVIAGVFRISVAAVSKVINGKNRTGKS